MLGKNPVKTTSLLSLPLSLAHVECGSLQSQSTRDPFGAMTVWQRDNTIIAATLELLSSFRQLKDELIIHYE